MASIGQLEVPISTVLLEFEVADYVITLHNWNVQNRMVLLTNCAH